MKVTKSLVEITFNFSNEKEIESYMQKFAKVFNEQKDKYEFIVKAIEDTVKELNKKGE